MAAAGISKPYLDAWLRRAAKALAGSGKLSELALILAGDGEMDAVAWRARMKRILDREEEPGFELLTKIDSVLARPAKSTGNGAEAGDLFQ